MPENIDPLERAVTHCVQRGLKGCRWGSENQRRGSIWHQRQQAVNIEPDPHYYELLGGSYADRDRWFEAENAFRKAAELNPTNGSLVRNLGACLANQGKLDDAFKKFEEACRIDPTDAVAQQATEQLRAHLERNKRAEDMQSEKGN